MSFGGSSESEEGMSQDEVDEEGEEGVEDGQEEIEGYNTNSKGNAIIGHSSSHPTLLLPSLLLPTSDATTLNIPLKRTASSIAGASSSSAVAGTTTFSGATSMINNTTGGESAELRG